jgi:hypothetical protein
MQYLRLKKRNRSRRDGRAWVQAIVIKKSRKFGRVISEQHISTKRPILIAGAHASGKSYWLDRLRKEAPKVWPGRAGAAPLHLMASNSLREWVHGKHLELWWSSRQNPEDNRPWSKLMPFEKYQALPLYLQETGAVLFIDDAHAFNTETKKGKLAQACLRAAQVWVMATQDEGRLFPGLREDVRIAEPQRFRLDSEVAYDATPVVMWLFMFIAVGLGYWELAAALGGLKMLGSGRRAAKQA